jgi:hypothetical protein
MEEESSTWCHRPALEPYTRSLLFENAREKFGGRRRQNDVPQPLCRLPDFEQTRELARWLRGIDSQPLAAWRCAPSSHLRDDDAQILSEADVSGRALRSRKLHRGLSEGRLVTVGMGYEQLL